MSARPFENAGLKRFAMFTAAMTFVLVWVGGLVTSKGYGLAVPDWPNTYGYNMFFFPPSKWIGGVLFEHSHRLLASSVGFFTIILTFWLFGRNSRPVLRWIGLGFVIAGLTLCPIFPAHVRENISLSILGLAAVAGSFLWPNNAPAPRWQRVLGVIALVAVIVQGVLGGLRVTQLDARIGIFHATLAQLFLVTLCVIALAQTEFWRRLPVQAEKDPAHLRQFFILTACLVLGQLVLGATMRHQHAGLSIPDFPLAYGKIWPDTSAAAMARYNENRPEAFDKPITVAQVELQMVHRLMALAILAAVSGVAWRAWRVLGRRHALTRAALVWLGLVLAQAVLGAATIWTGKAADIATAHVACGALCLVAGGIGSVISCRMLAAPAAQSVAAKKNGMTTLLASSSMGR